MYNSCVSILVVQKVQLWHSTPHHSTAEAQSEVTAQSHAVSEWTYTISCVRNLR